MTAIKYLLSLVVIVAAPISPASAEVWRTYRNMNNVQDMAIDGDSIWMTQGAEGVIRWNKNSGLLTRYTDLNGLKGNLTNRVFKDSRSGIWIPNGNGVSLYDNGQWKFFGPEDGILMEYVECITEDRKGMLWFGTVNEGIWTYDGNDWTQYNKMTWNFMKDITSVAAENGGEALASGLGGVFKFDGKSWKVFATQDSGLAHNWTYSIARDRKGWIWAGTVSGLSVFDGTTWKTIEGTESSWQINDIVIDSEDNAWAATYKHILKIENGKPMIIEEGGFTSAVIDSSGVKWFGSTFNGVLRLEGETRTWHPQSPNGPANNIINDLAIDREGALWAATSSGLSRYDGVEWETIAAIGVSSVAADARGKIWIGTEGRELYTYQDGNWEMFTGLGPWQMPVIRCMASDTAGGVWMGTESGAAYHDGDDWRYYSSLNMIQSNYISQIAADADNRIWAACPNSPIYSYDGHFWRAYGESTSMYSSIGVDSKGTKWIPAGRRLYTLDGNAPENSRLTEYPNDSIPRAVRSLKTVVIDPDDVKWFTVHNNGVASLAGETWTHYTMSDGLADSSITRIVIGDDKSVWACSVRGVSRLENGTWNTMRIAENSLANNTIYTAAVDSAGNKWFGTAIGVSCLRNGEWVNYTPADGLPLGRAASAAVGADGTVWIGHLRLSTDIDMFNGGGLSRHDGGQWTTVFENKQIDAVFPDREGLLWVVYSDPKTTWGWPSNNATIAVLRNQTWDIITPPLEIASRYLLSAAVDKNNVKWFCLLEKGAEIKYYVYRYDGQTSVKNPDPDTVFLLTSGISDVLWFASADGTMLTRYNGSEWKKFTPPFTFGSGRNKNTAVVDADGVTWFGIPDGLVRFDGENWKLFKHADGIQFTAYPYAINALAVDRNNNKWVCTKSGIAELLGETTAVSEQAERPSAFTVSAFPNPFNPTVTITYALPYPGMTTLAVYDITGRRVRTLMESALPGGTHRTVWDGTDDTGATAASGIYFARVASGNRAAACKMLLMK